MREIDPKVFGPGTWIVTHVLGLLADQSRKKKDRDFYRLYVSRMVHSLPCGTCRRHAIKYLREHPVPDEGMFEWSFTFHNTVNARLGKSILTLDQARELYSNTELVLNSKETGETCSIKTSSCHDEPL